MTMRPQAQMANAYRPRHLDEMVGQELPVRILRNFLRGHREDGVAVSMPNVLMLVGPTGCGKTTAARAVGAAASCAKFDPETGRGCGVCGDCEASLEGVFSGRNFLFLDPTQPGSKSLVTETLKRFVTTAPAGGARRVVCVADEIQTFSSSAKDALLTVVENLPPTALLICTTMEPETIDEAVLNRAVVIEFGAVPAQEMVPMAMKLCDQEDRPGLEVLAAASNGSVRKFWSLVQKSHAAADGGIITTELARECLGLAPEKTINGLVKAVVDGDFRMILRGVDFIKRKGIPMGVAMQQVEEALLKVVAEAPLAKNWVPALATLSFSVVQGRDDRYVSALVGASAIANEQGHAAKAAGFKELMEEVSDERMSLNLRPLLGEKEPEPAKPNRARAIGIDASILWK